MAKQLKKKAPTKKPKARAAKSPLRVRRDVAAPDHKGGLSRRLASRMARVVADAAESTCLEMPAAVALVRGCLGGTLPGLDTRLGDRFPDPDERSQFCQCVADGAGVSRAQIPCGEGTKVGEVIGAIAC